MRVELGKTYTDKITGYTGEATGRAVYKDDNTQVQLEGGPHDGKPVPARWFSECRLREASEAPATEADDAPAPPTDAAA